MNKREQLEVVRQSILTEIYRMSLELGLDPETLDINSFAFNEPKMDRQNNFNAHCYKLQIVEKRLREIE